LALNNSTVNANVNAQRNLSVVGDSTINGTFTNVANTTLTIVAATLTATDGLTNNGSIVLTDPQDIGPRISGLTVTGGALLNQPGATILATTDVLIGPGGPRQINAQLMNHGTVTIDEDTAFTGSVTNTTVTSGPGATINVLFGDLMVNLTGPATSFTQQANLTVANGHSLVLEGGNFVTTGVNTLSPSGSLLVDGSYSQDQFGSRLDLNGGVLTVGGQIDIQRGILAGPGVINGNVFMDVFSTLDVGGNGFPGVLTINGDFAQSNLASTVIRIANTTPGAGFDQLNITCQATLDGNLLISLIAGFQPQTGDSFTVMTFASRTGTMGVTGDGALFTPNFDDGDVTLVAN
jgi:hypothetical protein